MEKKTKLKCLVQMWKVTLVRNLLRLKVKKMYCVADDILCKLGLPKEVAFVIQNSDEVNFVKRDDCKEVIDLNVIIVNLTDEKISPQHPKFPPKNPSN